MGYNWGDIELKLIDGDSVLDKNAFERALELLRNQKLEPHRCILHPRVEHGKIAHCLECGTPWKQVNGRIEPYYESENSAS